MSIPLSARGASPLPPEDRANHLAFLFFMTTVGISLLAALVSVFFV